MVHLGTRMHEGLFWHDSCILCLEINIGPQMDYCSNLLYHRPLRHRSYAVYIKVIRLSYKGYDLIILGREVEKPYYIRSEKCS